MIKTTVPRRPEWSSWARRRIIAGIPEVPTLHLVGTDTIDTVAPVALCGATGPFTADITGLKEFCGECWSRSWQTTPKSP